MTLASPLWLLALLLVPAFAFLGRRIRSSDGARMDSMVTAAMFERIGRRFPPRVETLRSAFLLTGAVFLVLALARPQWGIVRERVERTGVDVALVLDTSLSMSVEDVSPNRFFLARQSLSALMSRLAGDRFSLVAFEGEAYPLVPLTLDADAVALFLETLEPGFVPTPGSNLLSGIEAGIATFVDPSRVNRVIVLVSDGEDLEDSLEAAAAAAKKAGVIIHTVGVGSAQGGPVPDTDSSGARNGYKLENGEPVISRLNSENLIRLAQATGGKFTQATSNNMSLPVTASAIEAMENKQTASEFSFRKKERFQIPLALSFLSFLIALFAPVLMQRARLKRAPLAAAVLLLLANAVQADVKDEILARPSRETNKGLKAWETGDAAQALAAFEKARAARPDSAVTRFNEAVAQAKAGKGPEAIETFTALSREKNDLGFESHYNLGNALLGAQQLPGAVAAYRDALRLRPDDARARRNLEIALRQLQQKKKDQEKDKDKKDQKDDQKDKEQQKKQPSQSDEKKEPQKTQKERENERFQKETGMSKDRAMQLLKALEQNEKTEQKKKLEAERAKRRKGKDW
ncbi:MAG: VWA domain-containing protein [Vicinamibacteria bacterium]|nr:VWA domain-containing protein [Vicinamibacteria bacterium]